LKPVQLCGQMKQVIEKKMPLESPEIRHLKKSVVNSQF
jgi:hypothetical protein